jgi:hypothetical protein
LYGRDEVVNDSMDYEDDRRAEAILAGEIAMSIPAFREGSTMIANGAWQILRLNLCIQSGFDNNCLHLLKIGD